MSTVREKTFVDKMRKTKNYHTVRKQKIIDTMKNTIVTVGKKQTIFERMRKIIVDKVRKHSLIQ